MNRVMFLAVAVLGIGLLFSCKKDKDEFTSADLVGTWRVEKEVATNGNVIDYLSTSDFRLVFTASKLTSYVDGSLADGPHSYTVEGANTIRLDANNWYTYEYKDDRLYLYRWGATTSDDGSYWVCAKL